MSVPRMFYHRSICICAWLVAICVLASIAPAQEDEASGPGSQPPGNVSTATATVPRMIRIRGTLRDASGDPLSGPIGITFSLYKDQNGGTALLEERHDVDADANGHYSVLLGATKPEGLPLDPFAGGEARWLGIRPDGQPESRILLLSVPYALKAADAETLGGKPPSAFVLADAQSRTAESTPLTAVAVSTGTPLLTDQTACTSVTSDGSASANQVAVFTGPCNIEGSAIFESNGNVGIGNTSPAGVLDVSGNVFARGSLFLPSQGPATSSAGFKSNPLDLQASSFNSSNSAAVNQDFQWVAEPSGNDSSSPSGTLNLLFGSNGAAPAETGLSIAHNGLITFASGQTFPGTGKGSVTSVSTGAGLTGGPITTSGTISIPSAGVSNSMLANSSITVKAGSGLSGGGSVALGGTVTLTNAAPSSGGTVTSVSSGTGIIGGPITNTGTLSLDTSFTDARYVRISGGSLTLTGTLTTAGAVLPPVSTATASTAYDSSPLDVQASAYNTAIVGPATYDFRLQAEPTGNDTTNTAALLHLLYGVPGDIAETGLVVDRFGDVTTRGTFQSGTFGSSTSTGDVIVRGGTDSNAAIVSGGLVARGADNASAASTAAGGMLLERPGLLTGTSPAGSMGIREAGNGYLKGSIVTRWNVQCMTKTANTTADCAAASTNGNVLGVASSTSTPVLVIESGNVPINATAAVTIGDTVCLSSSVAGLITDSGGTSPCATNPNFQGAVVATSGSVVVANGSGTPTSVTLSTTLPLVHLIGR